MHTFRILDNRDSTRIRDIRGRFQQLSAEFHSLQDRRIDVRVTAK